MLKFYILFLLIVISLAVNNPVLGEIKALYIETQHNQTQEAYTFMYEIIIPQYKDHIKKTAEKSFEFEFTEAIVCTRFLLWETCTIPNIHLRDKTIVALNHVGFNATRSSYRDYNGEVIFYEAWITITWND